MDYEPPAVVSRGRKKDYALEPTPIGFGGQAEVFRAIHKPTGALVAFKRYRSKLDGSVARAIREIEVGHGIHHPNVMPITDWSSSHKWLVMPWADGTMVEHRERLTRDLGRLRMMISQVCAGLGAAHDRGWVHRDVKPSNILWLELDADSRWAVSDWGLVRRPAGETTDQGRTRTGALLGTVGFAAPELAVDAHDAGPATDVYSVGQVIGWVLTGQEPQPNVALLPPFGPWRSIVKSATRPDPSRRPSSMSAFLDLIDHHLDAPPATPASIGDGLITDLADGRQDALAELVQLAATHDDDYALYIDTLPKLTQPDVEVAVSELPDLMADMVSGYMAHLEGDWGYRDFDHANEVIGLLLDAARAAGRASSFDLLESASEALFAWDAVWNRWPIQRSIKTWLRALTGDSARIVGAALKEHGDSATHFHDIADDVTVDPRIAAVLA